ncbi:hypothetical protein, partial [Peribacillus sp. NPDC060253]|uniref:hypothetical protein n=1 Tax=Peribacillus sp. NPDC060253 TaxID=3347084 RepID=UPI003653BC7B
LIDIVILPFQILTVNIENTKKILFSISECSRRRTKSQDVRGTIVLRAGFAQDKENYENDSSIIGKCLLFEEVHDFSRRS